LTLCNPYPGIGFWEPRGSQGGPRGEAQERPGGSPRGGPEGRPGTAKGGGPRGD